MTLFKLDKQFFTLHATAERLRSETWQYVQLSGRYSGHHGHHNHHTIPTHANQFVYYCSQLEKINLKRVNDEYVKSNEEHQHPPTNARPIPNQSQNQNQNDMSVPSPAELGTPDSVSSRIPITQDSRNILEDDASDKKNTIILQVSESDETMPQKDSKQFSLLPETPPLQGKPAI
jgi:hypothetical protein